MPPMSILAATTLSTLIGRLLWNLAASVVMIIAVIRVFAVAAAAWPRKHWSKAAWIAAALWVTWHLGGLVVPVGAIAAIVQARAAVQRAETPPPIPALPLAPSTPWTDPADETGGAESGGNAGTEDRA